MFGILFFFSVLCVLYARYVSAKRLKIIHGVKVTTGQKMPLARGVVEGTM
jgi:hypothetical protein